MIWKYHKTTFVADGVVNQEYWKWRHQGMNATDPIRYPVGFDARHKCLGVIWNSIDPLLNDVEFDYQGKMLDYVESRKKVYVPQYLEAVENKPRLASLKQKLDKGENLLVIEVDGPHKESMPYYREKYQVSDDFIVRDTILVTPENMKIMLDDEKHPFGHGYCLGMALLGLTVKDLE